MPLLAVRRQWLHRIGSRSSGCCRLPVDCPAASPWPEEDGRETMGGSDDGAIMARRDAGRLNGIGFGTWAWGNQLVWGYQPERDDPLLEETFREAVRSGLRLVDTADSYGTGRLNGRSEALLGRFVQALPAPLQGELLVATKLAPFPWRLGRRGLDRAFAASRDRLQGNLQRVQLHWSTARYAPWQEVSLLDGLADLVLSGAVRELGVSNTGPRRLEWMQDRLEQRGVRLSSVQVQFSLMAPGDHRLQDLLAICRKRSIEVLAYSPLAFGVLGQPPDAQPRPGTLLRRRLFNRLLPASLPLRQELKGMADRRGVSMVQVALNWCRAHGTTPIPGLRSPDQARQAAAALSWELTPEEQDRLDTIRSRCPVRMPANPFESA